jgi:hypothetical protein
MIPQAFINEWRQFAPWITEAQIEQDLVLSRAIVAALLLFIDLTPKANL